MNQILEKAKKLVVPTLIQQKQKTQVAREAFELVNAQKSKYPEIIDIEFGGSYAKGTWLPEKADVDIFIKFKKETPEQRFTKIAKSVGFDALKKFKPYVRYSDHPYVEAKIKQTIVNVVPSYDVQKGKWQSAADRSSFHTEFMLESLSGPMKDDVRLLKRFCKSIGIYGAEIAKQGFSGYVTEVLVWNFQTFEGVLEYFATIQENQVIGKATKKFDTSISIIDPIDSNRNLAAAISKENLGKFILASRVFLKKPSMNFFKAKPRRLKKENLKNILVLSFSYKQRSPDIIWGQAKRAASSISSQLELAGFNVLRKTALVDEKNLGNLVFFFESLQISENHQKNGPSFFNNEDSQKFISKNRKKTMLLWIGKQGKIASLEKRQYSDAKKFLENLLKKNLEKSGLPKGLHADLKKGFKIVSGSKASGKSIKEVLVDFSTTDETIFSFNQ